MLESVTKLPTTPPTNLPPARLPYQKHAGEFMRNTYGKLRNMCQTEMVSSEEFEAIVKDETRWHEVLLLTHDINPEVPRGVWVCACACSRARDRVSIVICDRPHRPVYFLGSSSLPIIRSDDEPKKYTGR